MTIVASATQMVRNRQISNIKVTQLEPLGGIERVKVTWLDEVLDHQEAIRFGRVAQEIIVDLAAVDAMGPEYRHVYLIGRIRGFSDPQGGD